LVRREAGSAEREASRPASLSVALTRVDNCEPRAPFQIADESRAKLGIARNADLIGAFEQKCDPAAALNLGQRASSTLTDHVRMSPQLGAVNFRAAEDLAHERGDLLYVVGRHACEDRSEDRIGRDPIIEGGEQPRDRYRATDPLIQRRDWSGVGHVVGRGQ
jgi:hypothetical protein